LITAQSQARANLVTWSKQIRSSIVEVSDVKVNLKFCIEGEPSSAIMARVGIAPAILRQFAAARRRDGRTGRLDRHAGKAAFATPPRGLWCPNGNLSAFNISHFTITVMTFQHQQEYQ